MRSVLALDIGGTKLAAAVVTSDGVVLAGERRATGGVDGEALFASVVDLLVSVRGTAVDLGVDASDLAALGVGCPDPADPGLFEIVEQFEAARGIARGHDGDFAIIPAA